jgi:hypothetical protein
MGSEAFVMRHFGSSLVLLAVGLFTLAGASGCELQECETEEGKSALCAKSLTRFVGEEESETLPYTVGTNLRVDGIYGEINVFSGAAGEVEVVFEPFNYRAHDAEDAARDELENNFDRSFELSGDTLVVTTGRHDATNGLGSNIDVYLPPEFDGAIVVRNDSDGPVNPGKVDVEFVGAAWSVDVATDDLGDCTIDGADSVVYTRARCDGAITVIGVSDEVDVASTGLAGDVAVVMTSIASAESGGSITSEDGDIDVTFPEDAEFSVQAQSTEDGSVDASSLDDACVGDVAAESAKSYTCGAGGPNFVVTAGTDGVGPSSVRLDLR